SPTGFPFKVVNLAGTNALQDEYARRERVCDLGYLRTAYRRPDGRLDYRCAAEPGDAFVKTGGAVEDTVGRKCLCNGRLANVGHRHVREEGPGRPILTRADGLKCMAPFVGHDGYSADDVITYLIGDLTPPPGAVGREQPARALALHE